MIESIIILTLIVVLFLAVADNVRVRLLRAKVLAKYVQSEIDKSIVSEKMQEMLAEKELNALQNSDGFLKFVSDSRDWAFGYIEDVQKALEEFDAKISPVIEYYSTYGTAVGGLHTDVVAQVSEAYEDLKRVLPSK